MKEGEKGESERQTQIDIYKEKQTDTQTGKQTYRQENRQTAERHRKRRKNKGTVTGRKELE